MEFRDERWANLVFISTIDKRRNRKDIAEKWGVPKTKLYQGSVERETDRLNRVSILDKNKKGIKAEIDSRSFKTELESYINKENDKNTAKKFNSLSENAEKFLDFIEREKIQKNVFKLDNIVKFYDKNARDAKKNPFKIFYLVGLKIFGKFDKSACRPEHNPEPILNAVEKTAKKIDAEYNV
jgi:hypothetical protein